MNRLEKIMLGFVIAAFVFGLLAFVLACVAYDRAEHHDHEEFDLVADHTHLATWPSKAGTFETEIAQRTWVPFHRPFFGNTPHVAIQRAHNEKGDTIGNIENGWDSTGFVYDPVTSLAMFDKLAFTDSAAVPADEHNGLAITWGSGPSPANHMIPVLLSQNSANRLFLKFAHKEFPEGKQDWPSPTGHLEDYDTGITATNYVVINDPNTRLPVIIYTDGGGGLNSFHVYFHAFHYDQYGILPASATGNVTPISAIADADNTIRPSVAVINGRVSVAYITITGDLKYVQCTNSTTPTWGPVYPITSAYAITLAPSLVQLHGTHQVPAVAFYDSATPAVLVLVADDNFGTAWTTAPLTLDTGHTTQELHMTTDRFHNYVLYVRQQNPAMQWRIFVKLAWSTTTDQAAQGVDVFGVDVNTSRFYVERDLNGDVWVASLLVVQPAPLEQNLAVARYNTGGFAPTVFNWARTFLVNDVTKFAMGTMDGRPMLFFAEKDTAPNPVYERHYFNHFGRLGRVTNGWYTAYEVNHDMSYETSYQ